MKMRHVFIADSLETAGRCVQQARHLGLDDNDISLVARNDVELHQIPQDLLDSAPTDTVPAAMRGMVGGGATGLLFGLIASAIPPLGVTLAGAALFGVVGASIGTWSAALMGSAIPNEVHREFEDSIAAGKVLVVLDAEEEQLARADALMSKEGARKTAYESMSALS